MYHLEAPRIPLVTRRRKPSRRIELSYSCVLGSIRLAKSPTITELTCADLVGVDNRGPVFCLACTTPQPRIVKLAPPPRRFLPPKPQPHHKTSLLRYLFSRSIRDRYRERLIDFRLDTLPYYKHRFQSRIYQFILSRQRRRREQSRLVDYARRLLLGPSNPTVPSALRGRHATNAGKGDKSRSIMSYMPGYGSGNGIGSGGGGYGSDDGRGQGGRRRRLAAMAGRVYSAGASAMSEIKESYNQTRTAQIDTPELAKITIPGSFPDVTIVHKGNEQMVLFPSYAKRHVKSKPRQFDKPAGPPHTSSVGMDEEEYWKQEWARHEDEKAIVDVDVRGWFYNPHRGPMTRRNRVLIGLARQLSGVPAPTAQQQNAEPSLASKHQQHEEEREQARIAQKAKEIEQKGKAEEEAAQKGGYSEPPKDPDSEDEYNRLRPQKSRSPTPSVRSSRTAPSSPTLGSIKRAATGGGMELNEAELVVANANLMARIGPFLTTPRAQVPITVFFYDDTQSQSRTVETNDSGHFILRAALNFVPTHIRVLANEDISVTEPVQVIEPQGISLISDIDDTIKHSNIGSGAKEIFRNTFIRDLGDLTVDGVTEWYTTLHDLGVRIHYCSNSPWQLFPVIASYFKLAGLPPGSIHLKQYSGMLQGIFEPVAERKKGTLEKIMNDFPERRFLLVGDSGEADLEVYTEIAVANPGRIAAIFIRDVTTPEHAGYFDSGVGGGGRDHGRRRALNDRVHRESRGSSVDDLERRPPLPARTASDPLTSDSPVMGDLIDFSDEPEQLHLSESRHLAELQEQQPQKAADSLKKKSAPPRPAKPISLQSSPSLVSGNHAEQRKVLPPPPARKASPASGAPSKSAIPHPLTQMHNSSQQTVDGSQQNLSKTRSEEQRSSATSSNSTSSKSSAPPPPPPRRRGTPSSILPLSPRLVAAKRRSTPNSDIENIEALPPPSYQNNRGGGSPSDVPTNKKLDLWRRRLQRAQQTLDREGVALYTWKRGGDVIEEAVGIVKGAMKDMGIQEGVGEKLDLSHKQ
ncbi:hypothetical protein BJ170DRAFT_733085 [Xylariales sp. AK1849]|nr:hypothetical protein BJ170DRAFT_733085 [Xylariales sp. AK1849]